MSSDPTSHFITLPNRPIVQDNGETTQGPLKLHYWEWKGHQPTILFCHAASFHGRCYDRIINEALHGYHVISLDLRGHGQSQKHPAPYRLRWIGEDVLHFIEILNLPKNNLIGIGHSLGGYALTYAAVIASTKLFRSLLLCDPAIIVYSLYGVGDKRLESVEYILRRKTQWSSLEDMISRYEKRTPFSRWPKDTLRDYCTYAIDENYKLRCSSEEEHSVYQSASASDSNIYPLIEQSKFINDIPIHIIRSSLPHILGQYDTSPTATDLVKWFKKGQDTRLENATHMFPMEQPQVMINIVKEIVKENIRSNL